LLLSRSKTLSRFGTNNTFSCRVSGNLCGLLLRSLSFHLILSTLPSSLHRMLVNHCHCPHAQELLSQTRRPTPTSLKRKNLDQQSSGGIGLDSCPNFCSKGDHIKVFQPHLQGTLLVLIPDYFLTQRENICERLYHSRSTRWNVGGPIRLCCISDEIHVGIPVMATMKVIEAICRRLGYTGLKPDHEKAVRSFMNGQDLFESLTTSCGNF